MRIRKVVQRRHRRSSPGTSVANDVNVVLAANVQTPTETHASAQQHVRVVQRSTDPPPTSAAGSNEPTEGETNG